MRSSHWDQRTAVRVSSSATVQPMAPAFFCDSAPATVIFEMVVPVASAAHVACIIATLAMNSVWAMRAICFKIHLISHLQTSSPPRRILQGSQSEAKNVPTLQPTLSLLPSQISAVNHDFCYTVAMNVGFFCKLQTANCRL